MVKKNAPDPASQAPAVTDPPETAESAVEQPGEETAEIALRRERDDFYDRLLRKTAEFDNYRKRIERERREQADQAVTDLLLELLQVVDDFDLALKVEAGDGAAGYKRGIELIHTKLHDVLRKQGVRPMEAIGADFDPQVHQAVMHEQPRASRRRSHRRAQTRLHDWRPAAPSGHGEGGEGVSKRDYYEILGVSRTCSESELKTAYRKLAMKHHPDKNPGDKAAEERFKEAAEAYAILADGEKRGLYDRFGHAGVKSAAGSGGFDPSVFSDFGDLGDILGGMFGFGDIFGGRRRGGPQRGSDLRYDLEISFERIREARRPRSRFPAKRTARPAAARAQRRDRHPRFARSAAVRGRFDSSRASSRLHAPARSAGERAASSRSRARPAAAPAAYRTRKSSPSRFPRASPTASRCGCRARARRELPAAHQATSSSSCTCTSTSSSGATA